MAILKCKMCGGTLDVETGSSVVNCEYCGTKQTIPLLDDEKKMQLFDRANSYRANCEFDKAELLYEEILSEYPDNAEANWGVCLCKYGIEYVDDKLKGKRTPTCHRTSFRSIFEDVNYRAAIINSDSAAKEVYRAEADYIDTVQRKILAISAKEEPFDIFICYKETDQNGDRTKDSVIAQEIYTDLTEMGYKVFFSKITLEDKLGIAYEPYIFAALNSAPLMLVLGTKPEYFNAVWVKNEWSRYLHMIEKGQKKTIVPCYRDMSASEMPSEFSILQAQDVSKVGWKQDLLRGIGKILPLEEKTKTTEKETAQSDKFEILNIRCAGAANKDDCWPNTPYSSEIDINNYSCVSFQVFMQRPFSASETVELYIKVMNAQGNIMCEDRSHVRVLPGNDRLAQVWMLKGSDGTSVPVGEYTVIMSINNGRAVKRSFRVVKENSYNYNNQVHVSELDMINFNVANQRSQKSLAVYVLLAFFLGMFGAHSFYIGDYKKARIQLIFLFVFGISRIWSLIDLFVALFRGVPTPKN